LAPVLARKGKDGCNVVGEELFGPTLAVTGAGISAAGRPRLPIRLMVGLLYLKHAYNESDESVCERWAENVYWAVFLRRGVLPDAAAVLPDQPRAFPAGPG